MGESALTYLSVCSGIEAATVAAHHLGWIPVGFAEIDPFCCELLARHYPKVPNYGDFTQIETVTPTPDALIGGTPCQDFSVAGLRAGLDGKRGNLTIEFIKLASRLRTRWLLWENVPGVLSIDGGRAFAAFLGGLAECGYGFAYRVLDAQHFGVPQRRRRVFVVGYLGDWRPAAAVLFERESLQGNPAPSRKAGERTAGTISARTEGGGGLGTDFDLGGGASVARTLKAKSNLSHRDDSDTVIALCLNGGGMNRIDAESETFVVETCPTLRSGGNQTGGDRPPGTDVDTCDSLVVTHALRADGFDASEDGTGRGTPLVPVLADTLRSHPRPGSNSDAGDIAPTLRSMGHDASHANAGRQIAVAFRAAGQERFTPSEICPPIAHTDGGGAGVPTVAFREGQTGCREYDSAGTLRSNGPGHDPVGTRVRSGMAVRRLTPKECERLQGFPEGYTQIPRGRKGAPTADGPRYKALGNSWAVPCVAWIFERMQMVDELLQEKGNS